ncbi:MAG: hypothetical protein IJ645_00090 [Ruminococcus sp.]|nr:hypothetical protein [Ruminococcus sp.]
MSIAELPTSLTVCGERFDIRSDFRDILVICQALDDDDLSDKEKAVVTLRCLFYDWKRLPRKGEGLEEALKKAYWFVGGGDIPKSKRSEVRVIDWKKDGHMIYPAVSKTLGVIDVRGLDYLHWFTFLGAFGENGDGLLSFVLSLRGKKARHKKLTKAEEEFLRNNKELIVIRSEKEQREIDETNDFLKELLGE